jgi:hypothetical protein
MITESQIRERLRDYLARKICLSTFQDWLVTQSWNMHRDSDKTAQRLVGAIELRLAEHSEDHLSKRELDRELADLISFPVSPKATSRTVPRRLGRVS